MKILIVEDDINIQNILQELLIKNNYEVTSAYSGSEALLLLEKNVFDLVLLDLMLPAISGEEIIKKVKNIPIIVLSAKISSDDKVKCLLFGASDYITKPFNIKIVLKKIEVILNRQKQENILKIKDLLIDFDNRALKKDNNIIYLTPTEFDLLNIFVKNKNTILTREVLLQKLWDSKKIL